ncbi:MAG: DUF2339 domain-containing protein, partial [Gloeobacteraceae cyanobacterium ES-bin-144]|nr:DUF2339 domain-containing protein [Verrucomicrobiales bacterium]
MEEFAVLGIVAVIGWLLIGPIIALVKAGNAQRAAKEARDALQGALGRLNSLENELRKLKSDPLPAPQPTAVTMTEVHTTEEPVLEQVAEEEEEPKTVAEPVVYEWMNVREATAETPRPPPLPQYQKMIYGDEKPPELTPEGPEEPKEVFSLEKFMGVKLFAWLGGVAMFFGVIFFVKYAFENNLIPPPVRIALGYVTGTGLLIGGLMAHRLERYRVLAQSFLATSVLILYGVSFAAHAVYHFAAFGTLTTFGLMALITFAAFLIAVRLNALVVAVLGMLGGFLTPVLLATGQDQVFGLFGYIALLDIGLLAISRHSRWGFLTSAAAVGTVLMEIGWYEKFFISRGYFEGAKSLIPMGVLLFFIVVFLIGGWLGRRRPGKHVAGAVLGLAAVAMLFSFMMLRFNQVAERFMLLYGFLLLVNLAVIVVVMFRPRFGMAQLVAAGLTFLHLAAWTHRYLTVDNLAGSLALYLVFGALHAVVPVLLSRRNPANAAMIPLKAGPWFAPLALVMMVMPMLWLSPVPMVVWVGILIADLLVIGLAVATGALLPVLASLALTMGVAALWLFRVPVHVASLMPFLGVITGFSVMFAVAGRWLFRETSTGGNGKIVQSTTALFLPVASAALPFALLVLALSRLPVANPSPVFGVALLMTALLLGLAILGKQGPLVLAALVGTLAVEAVWHLNHFQPNSPNVALGWYLGFYGLFLAIPFIFRKSSISESAWWIASALSGVGHFLLIHNLVKQAYPNSMMGLVPFAFAIPALVGLMVVVRKFPEMDAQQRSRIAWFGGVALFFITLIFPIQFQRQWITVSWAIEGALLLWLFRRVSHPGLQLTGLALLAISFIRLTLNPAVFTDYPRSGTAILNWHLYAYGLAAAAQFAGGHWFTDPAGRWTSISPRSILFGCGGLLLFLLLNIEIADYFTAPGDRCIAFRFGGNFARDMTY